MGGQTVSLNIVSAENRSLFIFELPLCFGEVVFLLKSFISPPLLDKTRKYCWTRLTKRSPSSVIVMPYWTSIHWYEHTGLYFSLNFLFLCSFYLLPVLMLGFFQFTEAKSYHNKLVNIRKDMITIHERTTKLKVR